MYVCMYMYINYEGQGLLLRYTLLVQPVSDYVFCNIKYYVMLSRK